MTAGVPRRALAPPSNAAGTRERLLRSAVVLLSGCDDDPAPPGESKVDVDTEELRHIKDQAGIEDCKEGPGDGSSPTSRCPASAAAPTSTSPHCAVRW